MIRAASLDLDADLGGFSQALQRQGLPHRIIEESGQQVIYVPSEELAGVVRQALEQWLTAGGGETETIAGGDLNGRERGGRQGALTGLVNWCLRTFLASPLTISLMLLCALVAVVTELGARTDRMDYLFFPLLPSSGFFTMLSGIDGPVTALRTLAPMLLHFGELHLVFNMLWLWYFGRQLETIQPAWFLALLIVFTAFSSNVTQYLYIQYNNFGGMSGVVYGLLGYTWLIHNFMPRSNLMLNNSMFGFFIVALVLMELLAGSYIATAAHVGGLLSGLAAGAAAVGFYRLVLKRQAIARPAARFQ